MKPIPKCYQLHRLTVDAEPGKGDNITCFAACAVETWRLNVPPASGLNRVVRRSYLHNLADYLEPVLALQIVRLMRQRERKNATSCVQ